MDGSTLADAGAGSVSGDGCRNEQLGDQIIGNRLALGEESIAFGSRCPRKRHELLGVCAPIDRCP